MRGEGGIETPVGKAASDMTDVRVGTRAPSAALSRVPPKLVEEAIGVRINVHRKRIDTKE